MVKRIAFLVSFYCLFLAGNVTAQQPFVSVSLSKKNAMIGEPVRVLIKVMTPTWFTRPVQFKNLQIDNAFTLSYAKTIPFTTKINYQTYAGIEFYYLVFPYQSGEVIFPALDIKVTTPKLGESKAIERSLKTNARVIKVLSIPDEFAYDEWLVANNVGVRGKWNKDLKNLKVGDVIEHTVTVRAAGTLSSFIPDTKIDSVAWATLYFEAPKMNENRNTENIYGSRTETVKYLLKKEGEFEIPEIIVRWYNPGTRKNNSVELPAQMIKVRANPDLEYLSSMQDSLDAYLQRKEPELVEKKLFLILGLKPWQFTIFVLVTLFVARIIVRAVLRLIEKYKLGRKQKQDSEEAWFKRLNSNRNKKDVVAYKYLHFWFDRYRKSGDTASFKDFLVNNEQSELLHNYAAINLALFSKDTKYNNMKFSKLIQGLKKIRSRKKLITKSNIFDVLNPK